MRTIFGRLALELKDDSLIIKIKVHPDESVDGDGVSCLFLDLTHKCTDSILAAFDCSSRHLPSPFRMSGKQYLFVIIDDVSDNRNNKTKVAVIHQS